MSIRHKLRAQITLIIDEDHVGLVLAPLNAKSAILLSRFYLASEVAGITAGAFCQCADDERDSPAGMVDFTVHAHRNKRKTKELRDIFLRELPEWASHPEKQP